MMHRLGLSWVREVCIGVVSCILEGPIGVVCWVVEGLNHQFLLIVLTGCWVHVLSPQGGIYDQQLFGKAKSNRQQSKQDMSRH